MHSRPYSSLISNRFHTPMAQIEPFGRAPLRPKKTINTLFDR